MTGNAVSGIGYGMGNYAFDPYFMAAYKSPNVLQNQQQIQAQNQTPTQTKPQVSGNNYTSGSALMFQGKKEEKSSNAAKWVLGIASAAALIYGGYKCHGKGVGDDFIGRIWDGAKKYWNEFVEWLPKFSQKPKEESLLPEANDIQ